MRLNLKIMVKSGDLKKVKSLECRIVQSTCHTMSYNSNLKNKVMPQKEPTKGGARVQTTHARRRQGGEGKGRVGQPRLGGPNQK